MRKTYLIFSLFLITGFIVQPASSGIDLGVTIDEDGIKSFHLAIGEYYNVPEKQVTIIKKRNVPDDELPVVYFIASKAGVQANVIVDLRLKGKSWMEITRLYKLDASIFYVNFSKKPGPPYGNAWGHFKNKKKNKWNEINLQDDDIVNLVNLKFISGHYGNSPEEVMEMRSKGRNFIEINHTYKQKKAAGKGKYSTKAHDTQKDSKQTKGKNKNK